MINLRTYPFTLLRFWGIKKSKSTRSSNHTMHAKKTRRLIANISRVFEFQGLGVGFLGLGSRMLPK